MLGALQALLPGWHPGTFGSVTPSSNWLSPQSLQPFPLLADTLLISSFLFPVVNVPPSPFPPWDGQCVLWIFNMATTYGPVTLNNLFFICTNWYFIQERNERITEKLCRWHQDREERWKLKDVPPVQNKSVCKSVFWWMIHIWVQPKLKIVLVGIIKYSFKIGDMCLEGKGQRYWKGHVNHSWTWVSRVQLWCLRELNGFFGCGSSKISCLTSVFGFHVITAGIPCSRLVSAAQTNKVEMNQR